MNPVPRRPGNVVNVQQRGQRPPCPGASALPQLEQRPDDDKSGVRSEARGPVVLVNEKRIPSRTDVVAWVVDRLKRKRIGRTQPLDPPEGAVLWIICQFLIGLQPDAGKQPVKRSARLAS
jgi:hypothetical protein